MRIGGLASGMDTESIVRDLMKVNRIPLDKITQKKQYLEWQLDDYRSVNRQLFDFSSNTFSNMILSTSFSQKTVSVSAPDAVSVKNISSTSNFSGSIQVHQLAKNATLQGEKLVNKDSEIKVTSSTKLEDLKDFNGEKIMKIQAINKEGKLEGVQELKFNATDTIDTVIKKINSETGVTAFFDEFSGKIAMTAKNSGKSDNGPEIIIGGKLAEVMNINGNSTQNGTDGQNAIFTFNGLKTERPSNTFQINGFEVSLKQVTEAGKDVTFSSAADTNKIFDNVVKYVDEYNKLIEDLNKQIREPKYRDFHPLSTEQKGDMKEKEIELWEEKAMSGTLRNDSTISSMLTQMRTALMGSVKGMDSGFDSLKAIGITTSNDYLANGKLIINEDELKKAISADPSKVHELFSKDGEKVEEQGFARRLRTIVDNSQKIIADKAGKVGSVNNTFSLGRNLNEMNKQIERFEDRMQQMESRYWKQFTAMETAMHRANTQYASLMNAFGGM